LASLTVQEANSSGVGDRTIEPPSAVRGEFMRQNSPSSAAAVSV
jgi:hypothetical protein